LNEQNVALSREFRRLKASISGDYCVEVAIPNRNIVAANHKDLLRNTKCLSGQQKPQRNLICKSPENHSKEL